jgi:hypothetical protein
MGEKIDNSRVVAGRLIRVKNTKKIKFSNAKNEYIAVWVEDPNNKNERCLLFTERELNIAEERAKKNPEDLTSKSFIQNLID